MVLNAFEELATGFEGCEKKVEIDFALKQEGVDLRAIPREAIDAICTLAKCTVISVEKNKHFDAYLLSESSLFIFPTKVLLKTCGTTLLLKCVSAILSAAKAVGAVPDFLQFSRSNFMFPQKQHFPHRGFSEETDYLNKVLGREGEAFILGPLQGPRWHLYIVDFNEIDAAQYKQQTMEMIMFNLPRETMKAFYEKKKLMEEAEAKEVDPEEEGKSESGADATKRSGIDKLLPGSTIDAFLFSPCGYSCNGLLDEAYFTIHITPEPECSFVSFETNLNTKSFTALARLVVQTFKPGSFCLSLFVDDQALIPDSRKGLEWAQMDGYISRATTHHMFPAGYNATCAHYELAPTTPAPSSSSSSSSNSKFGLVASSSAASLKLPLHPLDGLVGPASYETISSLSYPQLYTLARAATKEYIEIESEINSKELDVEHKHDEPILAHEGLGKNGEDDINTTRVSNCAKGVIARHSPEQSFLLVDLGQVVRKFHTWTQRFARIQPFYAVGPAGVDTGLLATLSALGCGFAFSHAAGLAHVISAGVPTHRILFERAFPSSAHLRLAREQHLEYLTFSSKEELQAIQVHYPKAKLLLRIAGSSEQSASHPGSVLGASAQDVPLLLLAAKGLGLSVVGVRFTAPAPVVDVDIAINFVKAAKDAFTNAAAAGSALHLLDLGECIDGLNTAEAQKFVALLDESFPSSVRFQADASEFLLDQAHTLCLSVLAKQKSAPYSLSPNNSKKRKADELASPAPSPSPASSSANSDFYVVSSALRPQSFPCLSHSWFVSSSNPSKPAPPSLPSACSLLTMDPHGAILRSISSRLPELVVGDWIAVSESEGWAPGEFFQPQPQYKGQEQEPRTFYIWS